MILITIFPIIAIVSASMAKGQSFTQASIFPTQWTLENYTKVLKGYRFYLLGKKFIINMYCSCNTSISVISASSICFF